MAALAPAIVGPASPERRPIECPTEPKKCRPGSGHLGRRPHPPGKSPFFIHSFVTSSVVMPGFIALRQGIEAVASDFVNFFLELRGLVSHQIRAVETGPVALEADAVDIENHKVSRPYDSVGGHVRHAVARSFTGANHETGPFQLFSSQFKECVGRNAGNLQLGHTRPQSLAYLPMGAFRNHAGHPQAVNFILGLNLSGIDHGHESVTNFKARTLESLN